MMAELATLRALSARVRGDLARAIDQYHRARELLPAEDLQLRALVLGGLADTYYLSGDIVAASPLFAEARAAGLEGGNIYQALVFSSRLAELQTMLGHLHLAADCYQQMLDLYAKWGEQDAAIAGYACIGLGEIAHERNDLDAAVQQIEEGIERAKQGTNPRMLLLGYIALSRTLQAQGDTDGALSALQEATRVRQQYPLARGWVVPPLAAYRARLALAQGDMASAALWAQEEELRADGEVGYQRETEYITLARLLIAQDNADEAVGLLQRLLENAEAGGRTSRVIEILLLLALSLQAQGDTGQAITPLEKAIALAEPEGFVRTFVDEGPPMAHLLREAAARGVMPDYAHKLLAAFEAEGHKGEYRPYLPPAPPAQPLFEPLSQRELEVLQLIAEGLTNPEIASRLILSVHTVKVHAHNIYGKLNVNSRTQAVVRAQALGLLPRR
jgi:LuxR family maltose regulon positive regulatory protein